MSMRVVLCVGEFSALLLDLGAYAIHPAWLNHSAECKPFLLPRHNQESCFSRSNDLNIA